MAARLVEGRGGEEATSNGYDHHQDLQVRSIGRVGTGSLIAETFFCEANGEHSEENGVAGHTGPVRAVAISCDGTRVVSGGDDALVNVWEGDTGVEVTPDIRPPPVLDHTPLYSPLYGGV